MAAWLVACLLAGASAPTGHARPTFTRSSSSNVTERPGPKGTERFIRNVRFEVVDVATSAGASDDLLLEEQATSHFAPGLEASLGQVTVLAWNDRGGRFKRLRWRLSDHADDGAVDQEWSLHPLFRTTRYGCCGGEDLLHYFDLSTGRPLGYATTPAAFVNVASEREKCMLTYVSDNAALGSAFWRAHPDALGLLTIRDGAQVTDQVVLSARKNEGPAWSPKLELASESEPDGAVDLTLWRARGDRSGQLPPFVVRLRFEDDSAQLVELPVVAGRFDLEHVRGPEAIRVSRAPPGSTLRAD